MRPAAFLDRDGTILHDTGYLSRREDLRWYPFAIDAIRVLNRADYLVFVVTNQGGVGLGLYEAAFVEETHVMMDRAIADAGGRVDGWFSCPHHPRARIEALRLDCACRKPNTGMIDAACARHPIDRARSVVIGDKHGDVELARRAGMTGVLVRTGQGEAELARWPDERPKTASDLMAAVAWMLANAAGTREG